MRTERGKFALYANWPPGTIEIEVPSEESGSMTTPHRWPRRAAKPAGRSPLEEELRETLQDEAIPRELHAPLPLSLSEAGARGLADYQRVEEYEQQQVETSHLPSIQSSQRKPLRRLTRCPG